MTIWKRPPARSCARATCVIVNTGWHHQYEDSEDYFC